jgi:large subunit ribosomal protein L29
MPEWNKEIIPGIRKQDLKPKELRKRTRKEQDEILLKLKEELMHERGVASMGGAPMSPGQIRAVRRSIARLITIILEDERAEAKKATEKPKPKVKKAPKIEPVKKVAKKGGKKKAKAPRKKKV